MASMALGVSAAAAAPPVNTGLPVLSSQTIYPGLVETTTSGTWSSGEAMFPFEYAWYFCNSSGAECKKITGATNSTYTVGAMGNGTTLVSSVTASNTYGSTTAYSKPTNPYVAGPWYWYACTKDAGWKPTESYSDAACTKEEAFGSYGWKKLTVAGTAFTMNGTTPFTQTWEVSGITVAATCSTQSSSGTASNPEKGSGTTNTMSFTFSGCAGAAAAVNCSASVSALQAKGDLTEFQAKPAVKFAVGKQTVTFSGAKCPALITGTHYFNEGSTTGVSNSATGSLEFTKASSSRLLGGKPVTLEGTSKVATSTGQPLKVGP